MFLFNIINSLLEQQTPVDSINHIQTYDIKINYFNTNVINGRYFIN